MAKNVFRFRRLKWGEPERPWLKRGAPLPGIGRNIEPADRRWFDSPWMIVAGFALAFGLGMMLFS